MNDKLYGDVIDLFGIEIQLVIVMEECAELIKEVSKFLRNNGNRYNLIEEFVDVKILLEQLIFIFNISPEEIENKYNEKIDRLKVFVSSMREKQKKGGIKKGDVPKFFSSRKV